MKITGYGHQGRWVMSKNCNKRAQRSWQRGLLWRRFISSVWVQCWSSYVKSLNAPPDSFDYQRNRYRVDRALLPSRGHGLWAFFIYRNLAWYHERAFTEHNDRWMVGIGELYGLFSWFIDSDVCAASLDVARPNTRYFIEYHHHFTVVFAKLAFKPLVCHPFIRRNRQRHRHDTRLLFYYPKL